jgi:alkylated DNA repair dioxygenase AlkB
MAGERVAPTGKHGQRHMVSTPGGLRGPASAFEGVAQELLAFVEPDAGIVNFYQTKDTLMGHVDRSEICATSPLVSIS